MSDLNWQNIDPATLSPAARAHYDTYKAAYKTASDARKAFEAQVVADAGVPAGKTLAFGYRFGKLSVALADAKDAPKAAAPKLSLAAYLATHNTR